MGALRIPSGSSLLCEIPMPLPRTLRQFGVVVLVIGLIGAGAVYWSAQRQETEEQRKAQLLSDSSDTGLSPDDSKRYTRDTEINMGKGVMVIDRFLGSVGQLFQGRNLAFMIAAVSIITAMGCFAIADRSPPS
jgi:hypothetical protein